MAKKKALDDVQEAIEVGAELAREDAPGKKGDKVAYAYDTAQDRLFASDPFSRLLMLCAMASENTGRPEAPSPIFPPWTDMAMERDLRSALEMWGEDRRIDGGYGARDPMPWDGVVRAIESLARLAGAKKTLEIEELKEARDTPANRKKAMKLFEEFFVDGMEALRSQSLADAELTAFMGRGRAYLEDSYGLGPEGQDELSRDPAACLALCRLAFGGPTALTRATTNSAYGSRPKKIFQDILGARGKAGQSRACAKLSKLSMALDGINFLGNPENDLRMALYALGAEGDFKAMARSALLDSTATREGESLGAEPEWAKINELGDLATSGEGSSRAVGVAARGGALSGALADFKEVLSWRNPLGWLSQRGANKPLGAGALSLMAKEVEHFDKHAPRALACAMRANVETGGARKEVAVALAKRAAEGFGKLGEDAAFEDYLPGLDIEALRPAVPEPKREKLGDPMEAVALSAAAVFGLDKYSRGLVGEAKSSLMGQAGLSNAGWKALAANPHLRAVFAKAAAEAAKLARSKGGLKQRSVKGEANAVMSEADRAGATLLARLEKLAKKDEANMALGAASVAVANGAMASQSPDVVAAVIVAMDPQADEVEQGYRGARNRYEAGLAAESLRAIASGALPLMPFGIANRWGGEGYKNLHGIRGLLGALGEEISALKAIGPAFALGFSRVLEKSLKEQGGRITAIAESLSELSDIIDMAGKVPVGFWAGLDPKNPYADAKRQHAQWVVLLGEREHREKAKTLGADFWPQVGKTGSAYACGRASAKEIYEVSAIFAEGKTMHHCVSSYVEKCIQGGSRLFALSLNGARSSTLELAPVDKQGRRLECDGRYMDPAWRERVDRWEVVQHKGKHNAEVRDPDELALALKIAQEASLEFKAISAPLIEARLAEKLAKKNASGKASEPKPAAGGKAL